MYCQNCGTKLEEGVKFCPNCGANSAKDIVEVVNTDGQNQSYNNEMYHDPKTNKDIPLEYKPLGAWAYFGWGLLFAIPIAGFIILIVFACGATNNINLRNYARSFFCSLLVVLIILLVFLIIFSIGASNVIREVSY